MQQNGWQLRRIAVETRALKADRPETAGAPSSSLPLSLPGFDEWVTASAPALARFAYLVTGDQAAAEDALQEALVTACARWSRIVRTDDPGAYVRRMIANAHISWWRRIGRRETPVQRFSRANLLLPTPRSRTNACGGFAAPWRPGSGQLLSCGSTKD